MPTNSLAAYSQLAEETSQRITHSYHEWTGFLKTAARLYKYPYHEQLMIYAQRPEATACAEYELWNKTMRRYVRRGSRGIALIDPTGDKPKLRYVFDIADTGGGEHSRRPFLWKIDERNARAVQAALETGYDVPAADGLERQIRAIAMQLTGAYWIDHRREMLGIVDGSYLEGYDEFNVGVSFRKAAAVSLEYALYSRCGLNPDERFLHEDFLPIFDWNTPEATAALGTAVSELSEEVLRTIEISVRNYERSHEHEQANVSAKRGLPDSQPDRGGSGAPAGPVRQAAPDIPRAEPSNIVQFPHRHREAAQPSAGDRGRGEQPAGADAARDGESGGRDGSAESLRPHEMGGADEQSESASGGGHSDGADLQLRPETAEADRAERSVTVEQTPAEEATRIPSSALQEVQLSFFPTEAAQIAEINRAESDMPSALVFAAHKFSDEEIDLVLQSGGSDPRSRMRIATEFSKGKSKVELAAFLQKEYRGGKGLVTGQGKVSAWFDADGVRLARGDAARYVSSARLVPWDDMVRRIDGLLERGMYATMDEWYLAGQQERTEIAQSLGYLRQEFSDEAVSRGLLPTLGERFVPFQDNVEKLAALLEQPEARQTITSELRAFVEAYEKEPALLRFHLHPPGELLRRVEELALPRKAYQSELLEPPALPGFITQDEIDGALAQGSVMAGGKQRIHAYLTQAHTPTEKADFLKREYGIGGRSHALSGMAGSWEEHDGKGICLRKDGCENVLLRWPEAARRIEALIRQNRYLTPEELERAKPPKRESPLTQEDIDQAIQEWTGDCESKRAVVRRLREETSPDERIAILREEYGDDMPAFPVNGKNGADDLPWEEVLDRVLTLIAEDRFFTEEEQDRLEDIDPIYIRKRLEESGIVGGEAADPEKLAQEPFIRQAEATAARMVQEETEQEIYDQYLPIIRNLVLADAAYQNACKNSDKENASLEGEAAIRRAVSTIQDTRFIRLYGDLGDFQAKLRRELLETTYSELAGQPVSQAPSYRVGDTVYLDDRPFEITEIRGNSIQLLDHALFYPIFRLERRETFENLLMLDPRNHTLMEAPSKETPAPEGNVTVPPQAREETAYVYPAEENHLPYDVVINRMHVEEAEREAPSPPQATPENFRITDDHLGEGGQKTKYGYNVTAIRTLQTIEAENRRATPEEQEILSRYVGWGGIPQAFDGQNADWSKEYAELKELLPEAEYASARASTLNAHYTSPTVIRAIYDAVERMGFTSGNILEPAMGVGNFFGMMPDSMRDSRLYGVELDSITGRIARQLYPKANITVSGFEKTDRRDFYDLAIGNVPFGNYQVQDRAYDKLHFNIHDYFFAKALDQVRPGGIIAFLTSKGTMDKQNPEVRRYIAQRAELLGAVRLPNNAFKANAGTEVTSDILFLQKREQPIDIEPDWVHLGMTEDGVPVNSYFVEHPEMLLGRMAWADSMYGSRQETACLPIEGAELGRQLAEALQNISGQIVPAQLPDLGEPAKRDTLPADPNVPNYAYAVIGGEIYYRENSVMVRPEVSPTAKERIRGMVRLRDCVRELIARQMEDAPEEIIQRSQARLSGLYDAYTAKYGLINSRANASVFSGDSSYYLLCSLEVLDENGALARKADMFTKRTIRPSRVAEHVDTAAEALALSIAERARVDMAYMAKISGKTRDELASDLHGVIFRLPESAESEPRYVTADEYLSGNVRSKLAQARKAAEVDKTFAPNVAALEQAMPRDLDASEIEVRLGATWIEPRYIQQFMLELLEPPIGVRYRLKVNFSDVTAEWNISNKSRIPYHDVAAYTTYGTSRASAYEILESTLNLRDVRIYDTVRDLDGKESRVLNPRETTLAQQKQQALKDAFKDWVWRDPIRRQELTQRYNQLFNSTRPREFSGEHITFSGMNPEIRLRPHQRDAIAHILYGGNTLLAHEVGAGKTFEMVAACMESKRLGLCHKALFAVPNHLTEQWASEFLRLYPSANILVATKKDFETKNRKKFCARIATGDYDAVIIGHSQFEKIPISWERQERMLNEQIAEIQEGIAEMMAAHAERFTIKQMERNRKQLECRLNKLLKQERKDDVVTFEQLGVDRLYVDEAHGYKNLFLATKMRNVAGLSTSEAQKSSDMYLKCRYMDELTGSRGTVFATGTPVSNSMTELYVRP